MSTEKNPPVARPKAAPAPSLARSAPDVGATIPARAVQRKLELEGLLAGLPPDEVRTRGYLTRALSAVAELLTGDLEHPSHPTATELSRWLEATKHLADMAARARRRPRH